MRHDLIRSLEFQQFPVELMMLWQKKNHPMSTGYCLVLGAAHKRLRYKIRVLHLWIWFFVNVAAYYFLKAYSFEPKFSLFGYVPLVSMAVLVVCASFLDKRKIPDHDKVFLDRVEQLTAILGNIGNSTIDQVREMMVNEVVHDAVMFLTSDEITGFDEESKRLRNLFETHYRLGAELGLLKERPERYIDRAEERRKQSKRKEFGGAMPN